MLHKHTSLLFSNTFTEEASGFRFQSFYLSIIGHARQADDDGVMSDHKMAPTVNTPSCDVWPLTPQGPTCGVMEESGNMRRSEQREETKKASQKTVKKRSKEEQDEEKDEVRVADWEEEEDNWVNWGETGD